MNQHKAIAFIRYTIAQHGAIDGCTLIADKLGIGWQTVYGWHRRDNVPQWRIEALERIRPAVLGASQAAE
jgi:hypothetical protein